jgi:hypothetical protein
MDDFHLVNEVYGEFFKHLNLWEHKRNPRPTAKAIQYLVIYSFTGHNSNFSINPRLKSKFLSKGGKK